MENRFRQAEQLRLMAFDIDGVMTDGHLYFTDSGEEIKAFHTLDGHGLKMLQASGVTLAIITGRTSRCVERRAANLGITRLFQGVEDKWSVFRDLCNDLALTPAQAGYMGDDVVDLPVLRRCGFAATVPEAPNVVKLHTHYIASLPAGRGAVREVCEFIMQAQGTWDTALASYLS